MIRRRIAALLLGLAIVWLALPAPVQAHAETTSSDQVLLLLDLSGSMSDQDQGGRIKIEGAKAGITSLLDSLPGSARVGLMTYPGDGACGEPTLVRPIQPLSQGNLGATVSGLAAPDGDTPTAAALRAAAGTLSRDGNATIVLVSDGLANCGEDPCPVAQEIVRSGVDLTVNTVGFDIDDDGRKQLECIAEATAGTYTDVRNGDDLGRQLAEQMRPRLTITPQFPTEKVAITAVGATVGATITNTAAVTATNVRVVLAPSGSGALLAVVRPSISLGNLAKDETRTVSWTVPTSSLLAGQAIQLTITASGSNAATTSQSGVIIFADGKGSLINPTSQFNGAGRVAVLGDSYSAGDGSHRNRGEYIEDLPGSRDCRRSSSAYAAVLFPGQVDNFACTGAVSAEVAGSYRSEKPRIKSQVEQLKDSLAAGKRYGLVFLTIGGNDVGFADIAATCIEKTLLGYLARGADVLPFLNPCPADPHSILYRPEQELLNAQSAVLQNTYADVAMTFSRSGLDVPPIIVSPYPMMVPTDPGLRWTCGSINLAVTMQQLRYFSDFQRQLNAIVEAAVSRTREETGVPVYFAKGVEQSLQPDHTLCGSQPWIVRPRLDNLPNLPVAPRYADTPFHPNADGYRAWAIQLARWSETPGLTLEHGTRPAGSPALPWIFTLAPRGKLTGDGTTDFTTAGEGRLTVTGLAPYSPVIAIAHSTPYPLGYATADRSGNATLVLHLDRHRLPPGRHQLQLAVVEPNGKATVRQSTLWIATPVPYAVWTLGALGTALLIVSLRMRRRARVQGRPPIIG